MRGKDIFELNRKCFSMTLNIRELEELAKMDKNLLAAFDAWEEISQSPETGKSVALTNEQKLNLEGKLVK